MTLSVAMRKAGVDEHRVAKGMAGLLDGLRTKGGDAKVLLDALKESTRVLAPPQGSDASIPVHLSHNVPRPVRDVARGGDDAKPG